MVSGRANTAAASLINANRPQAHGSCADLRHSLYGALVVLRGMEPTGAIGRELRHVECSVGGRLKTGKT
jgi:hypothetical protein